MSLRLAPAVLDDVEKSARFYRDIHPELGTRFRDALTATLRTIQQRPQSFPVVFGHRRALLRSFPYAIFFRTEDEGIFVLLIIHLARRPRLTSILLRRRADES